MHNYSTLAHNILLRRQQLGYTQKQLAVRSGVSVRTISALEHGRPGRQVSVTHIFRLAKALDCRMVELFL